jgi:hypothetical protein
MTSPARLGNISICHQNPDVPILLVGFCTVMRRAGGQSLSVSLLVSRSLLIPPSGFQCRAELILRREFRAAAPRGNAMPGNMPNWLDAEPETRRILSLAAFTPAELHEHDELIHLHRAGATKKSGRLQRLLRGIIKFTLCRVRAVAVVPASILHDVMPRTLRFFI